MRDLVDLYELKEIIDVFDDSCRCCQVVKYKNFNGKVASGRIPNDAFSALAEYFARPYDLD